MSVDEESNAASSVADRLAAELEGGGELVDEGGFDIDASRALDKLARFQLANPRAYVLRWAEAGLLAGATHLRFDIEGGRLCASFDRPGDPVVIPGAALERLLSVLLSREQTRVAGVPRELLAQLAVGVVAVLGLVPVFLAIESVGADGRGVQMQFSEGGRLRRIADAEPGTRIYLFEDAEVARRLAGAMGKREEHELLREHCRFASTPIYLDGRRISQQRVLDRPLRAEPVVREGVVIGEAGFVAEALPARVHLLSHGLLIQTLFLTDCRPGFVAAIDVPLPRDLSRAAIVRTPELDAALAPVYTVHAALRW